MNITVSIIGLVITLIVAIPVYFSMHSQDKNKKKIQKIIDSYSQGNSFRFSLTQTQNKKTLALDETNKKLLLIDLNTPEEHVYFVDLAEVKNCKLVTKTSNNRDETIVKIDFVFQNKESQKQDFTFPFYTIENDKIGQVCLYEDQQLAKKWQQSLQQILINN